MAKSAAQLLYGPVLYIVDSVCKTLQSRGQSDLHIRLGRGVVMHELLHNLGVRHEQNRPDARCTKQAELHNIFVKQKLKTSLLAFTTPLQSLNLNCKSQYLSPNTVAPNGSKHTAQTLNLKTVVGCPPPTFSLFCLEGTM